MRPITTAFRSRSGFSLVELLVAIAIIVLLLAVTVPAVQQAREAARKVQCQSHLKQIGLALHNYQEKFGALPPGWIGVSNQGGHDVLGKNGRGWAYHLLPEIEQDKLASRLDFNGARIPANQFAIRTGVRDSLDIFLCPSDGKADVWKIEDERGLRPLLTLAPADYVGNFGVGDVSYCETLEGTNLQCRGEDDGEFTGIFYHNSSTRLQDILDGTSNTLMVGEQATDTTTVPARRSTWVGVVAGGYMPFSRILASAIVTPNSPDAPLGTFHSAHTGVSNFLIADGHVASISDYVDTGVFQAAASGSRQSNGSGTVASAIHHGIPNGIDDDSEGPNLSSALGSDGSEDGSDSSGAALANGAADSSGTNDRIVHSELEELNESGSNDTQGTAEFISGLGTGPGQNPYALIIGQLANVNDVDYYTFEAHAGDVVGVNLYGNTSFFGFLNPAIGLLNPQDELLVATQFDENRFLSPESPLPFGGDNSLAYVVPEDGIYSVAVAGGLGSYAMHTRLFRPGLEYQEVGATQTLFLDFDGAFINTSIFVPPGEQTMATLSPFSSFLTSWDSPAEGIFIDTALLFETILDLVHARMVSDLASLGNNPNFGINILQNLDPSQPGYTIVDPFGSPNVSRVIVGGTVEQARIDTIGIAQSLDPGNFDTEESALVLMDYLANYLNYFQIYDEDLTGLDDAARAAELSRRKTLLVAQGFAYVIEHEAGHYLGSFHTDGLDGPLNANIMDEGGLEVFTQFENMLGLGPDDIWYSPDDVTVTYGVDAYSQFEGLFGNEDTLTTTVFGLSTGQGLGEIPPLPIGANIDPDNSPPVVILY